MEFRFKFAMIVGIGLLLTGGTASYAHLAAQERLALYASHRCALQAAESESDEAITEGCGAHGPQPQARQGAS